MKKLFVLSLFVAFIMSSCYDDYETDYDYTAAYFAYQSPVRTIILDQEEFTEVKIGATYGGRYSYEGKTEEVIFSIEDTMITNHPEYADMGIKVMPSNWYTLSDPEKISMVNSNGGSVTVSVIQDSIAKYDDGALNTYVIPFYMAEASTDSILEEKRKSLVLFKYKNEIDGRYYVRGIDRTLDASGNVVSSIEYNDPSLVLNKYIFANTISKDEVSIARIGANEDADNYVYHMQFSQDGKALLSPAPGTTVTQLVGAGQYDFANRTFVNNYNYALNGVEHSVTDTLIYSDTRIEREEWLP